MGIVVGIDIGGSTTKIAGFQGKDMLIPVQISASNAIASLFGAFGKFLYDNKLALEDIQQVNLTGVGCSAVDQAIYGLPTYRVDEFTANGVGGGYFAQGKKEFMSSAWEPARPVSGSRTASQRTWAASASAAARSSGFPS